MIDPTREDLLEAIKVFDPYADDFDVEEAIYWFASDFHDGQGSNLYSILSTSDYRPGACQTRPEYLDLYDYLVTIFQ